MLKIRLVFSGRLCLKLKDLNSSISWGECGVWFVWLVLVCWLSVVKLCMKVCNILGCRLLVLMWCFSLVRCFRFLCFWVIVLVSVVMVLLSGWCWCVLEKCWISIFLCVFRKMKWILMVCLCSLLICCGSWVMFELLCIFMVIVM